MTVNQINYQNLVEKQRNNQAIEAETQRHNQAIEDYNRGVLSQTEFQNKEVARHNTVMEQLQARANEIDSYRAQLTKLYNDAQIALGNRRAAEEERSNRINELLSSRRVEYEHQVNEAEAATHRYVAEQNVLLETARQTETARHNEATETETHRLNTHNIINAYIGNGLQVGKALLGTSTIGWLGEFGALGYAAGLG